MLIKLDYISTNYACMLRVLYLTSFHIQFFLLQLLAIYHIKPKTTMYVSHECLLYSPKHYYLIIDIVQCIAFICGLRISPVLLGPLLFSNDLPAIFQNSCVLFTDDLNFFSFVRNDDDAKTLQNDLNNLTFGLTLGSYHLILLYKDSVLYLVRTNHAF